jgi:hypothetical protein
MSARSWLAVLLLAASPGAFAINLVYNPDFDSNLDGWTPSGGAYRDSYFGSPVGGTLRLDALSFSATAEATQCVDVHRWTSIDFALRYFANYVGGYHQFKLDIYDAPNCGGNILDTLYPIEAAAVAVGGNPATGWYEAGDYGFVLAPGSMSAHIDLGVAGTPTTISAYLVDHVQVGPLDVIFADGLEP